MILCECDWFFKVSVCRKCFLWWSIIAGFLGILENVCSWFDGSGLNPYLCLGNINVTNEKLSKSYQADCFELIEDAYVKEILNPQHL